jgi:two-component system response regulator DevR
MPGSAGGSIRVYLLDDHDIVRQGIRDLLAPARDVFVAGSSSRAQGAAEAVLRLRIDVMVLDLHLQDGNGAQVCREVRAVDPSVRGLLLTSADDDEALAAALLAGAAGVVVKLANTSDILGAVRALGQGDSLLDAELVARATSLLRTRAAELSPPLVDEEQGVLDHLLAGHTDAEVAAALGSDLSTTQPLVGALVDRLLFRSAADRWH